MISDDGKFAGLLREARGRFEALSPEEQRAHRREQRISWVMGQLRLSGREITRADAERAVDAVDSCLLQVTNSTPPVFTARLKIRETCR